MRISAGRLDRGFKMFQAEYEAKALEVLRSGRYVLGSEVFEFEKEWAKYIGTNYCVGVASGLDALWMSFRVLGIGTGDEVIVCSNAYIACVMSITINGAVPVFVEPDHYDNLDATKIEDKITRKTKAILAVHLYGQSCDMSHIMELAHKYHIKVVEDCAQSHGNHWNGQTVGTFGDIGCFSFYPSKGCGAFGDGGAIVTNNKSIADSFRVYRNYGSRIRYQNEVVGTNSRLDEIQAGLLRVKLRHLDELNQDRCLIAQRYTDAIHNTEVSLPQIRPGSDSSWHQYVIHVRNGKRDALQQYLKEHDIETLIHYPIPPHLSEAYQYLGYRKGDFPIAEQFACEVLSLPMYNGMTEKEMDYIINTINRF